MNSDANTGTRETFGRAEVEILSRGAWLDVLKVHARRPKHGIAAEYGWIDRHYPGSEVAEQRLVALETAGGFVFFDVLEVEGPGVFQTVAFDIGSFFEGEAQNPLHPESTLGQQLLALYETPSDSSGDVSASGA